MFTALAVVLVGVWLIITSRGHLDRDVTLAFGILVVVLAAVDLFWPYWRGRRPPP